MLTAFAPDEVARCVTEIDLGALADRGIEGLLIDVDNTLLAYGARDMEPQRLAWARRAAERFGVCLLSNSVRGLRVRQVSEELGVPGISVWHWQRKPLSGGYRRALAEIGTSPERTAMIGDQLMTDIWGANRCGLYTIWVQPISAGEFVITRHVHRRLEAYIARKLTAAGLMPSYPEAGDEA
ncbi:MAG: YqeG family HAD IIIA-type phosphatase [Armatimonadota bacterium]|nr:YqeG family HAD IIIA-type phosphatase [Armatimonadota bacterium]